MFQNDIFDYGPEAEEEFERLKKDIKVANLMEGCYEVQEDWSHLEGIKEIMSIDGWEANIKLLQQYEDIIWPHLRNLLESKGFVFSEKLQEHFED